VSRFEDRNVVVTGGSSGIGRATVLAFAAEGAHVLAVGRNQERLAAVSSEAAEGAVEVATADVAAPDQARALVDDAIEGFGRLHVLVNNAGVAYHNPVLDLPERDWNQTLATNLSGPFFSSQVAARHMAEHGGGAIVNVASTNAFVGESPQADYNVSKAGLVMLTKSFGHELAHLGIRCNAVAPGQTLTPMVEPESDRDDFRRMYLKKVPMRRYGRPEEIAAAIVFLASDDASFVNGETLIVDGGQLTSEWYDAADAPPVPD
jgi:NAD(P)-dependent dehydrogenase (short-subunit alcohol dehydrogenase family)